jgi:predicted DNA repair protein MutK
VPPVSNLAHLRRTIEETGYANVQMSKFLLQHIVYVLAVLGRVREAARVDRNGCMLERRGRARWRRRFGNGVVDSVPDDFIRFIFEDCSKKWLNAFDVKVVSILFVTTPARVYKARELANITPIGQEVNRGNIEG